MCTKSEAKGRNQQRRRRRRLCFAPRARRKDRSCVISFIHSFKKCVLGLVIFIGPTIPTDRPTDRRVGLSQAGQDYVYIHLQVCSSQWAAWWPTAISSLRLKGKKHRRALSLNVRSMLMKRPRTFPTGISICKIIHSLVITADVSIFQWFNLWFGICCFGGLKRCIKIRIIRPINYGFCSINGRGSITRAR